MAVKNPNGTKKVPLIGITRQEDRTVIAYLALLLVNLKKNPGCMSEDSRLRIGKIAGEFIWQGRMLTQDQYEIVREMVGWSGENFELQFDELDAYEPADRRAIKHFGEHRASYRLTVLAELQASGVDLTVDEIAAMEFVKPFITERRSETKAKGEMKDDTIQKLEAKIAAMEAEQTNRNARLEQMMSMMMQMMAQQQGVPLMNGHAMPTVKLDS